jgi:protease I
MREGRDSFHRHPNGDEMPQISNARILIMATNRFEESELFGPREILVAKGATVVLASLDRADIMGTVHDEPGKTITPDLTIADADADTFDALLLPGGVSNPDRLRAEPAAVALIKAFDQAGKPIGAICHAPWLLVEADLLKGRRATSWPSIRTDLRNAGARVIDEAAVTDGTLVTSRNPDDVPAFTAALIAAIEAG